MSTIKYAVDDDRIATITFDRDDKRNAVNEEMAAQIMRRLEQAEQEARVVVLRANHDVKVWCAGHDLAELDPQALRAGNGTLDVVGRLQSTPLPVIALVEGSVYAGGLLILLAADIVIAAKNSQVAITSNRLGIPLEPELYAFWLRVMGLHKVKELLFTAATISADDACRTGLYNHVVETEELERTTYHVAQSILRCAPEAVANSKRQLNRMARQSALTDENLDEMQKQNVRLLNSAQTKARIEKLLASLKEPAD